MQQADGFIVDPMIAPTLRSGETGVIRKFLKEYAEYVAVWTERVNEESSQAVSIFQRWREMEV